MPGPAIAGIVGSVASGAIQSSAAKKAAKAQGAAADAQIAETRRQFDLVQSLLKPYVSAGTVGLQSQLDLMGLGGGGGTAPGITTTVIPGTSTGASTPSGWGFGTSADDRHSAMGGRGLGETQSTTQYSVNGQTFATLEEAQAYANANKTGGLSADDAQRAAISKIENGAQFGQLVKQGEYGLLANASATGGLRGGDTAAAMAQFRPAMLQSLIQQQLANYGGLAANGQNAAAMTGTAAQNAGAQVNAALGDKGAAQAGASLASGQAWSNAGSGILSTISGMAKPSTAGGGLWQKWTF